MMQGFPKNIKSTKGTAPSEDLIDVKAYIAKFWAKRALFLLSIILFFFLAFLLNIRSSPIYVVKASLYIRSELKNQNSQLLKEFEAFQSAVNLENEIQVLKSHSLVRSVVDSLQSNIKYYQKSFLSQKEVYGKKAPIRLVTAVASGSRKFQDYLFSVKVLDENQFSLSLMTSDSIAFVDKTFRFEESIKVFNKEFRFIRTDLFSPSVYGSEFDVKVHNIEDYTSRVISQLEISLLSLRGSILELKLETTVPEMGIDLVDKLVSTYIARELEMQNLTAIKTINFIDEQLASIQKSLFLAEDQLESFRRTNKVIDIDEEGSVVYNNLQDLGKILAKNDLELNYYDYLIEYLDNAEPKSIISPGTADISDPTLNSLVLKLNETSDQLVALGFSASEINPQVKRLKNQFESVLAAVRENALNLRNTARIRQADLKKRISEAETLLSKLPRNERELVDIKRDFNLNHEIYTYLLKEKAQAGISMATNEASSKVIDPAIKYLPSTKTGLFNYLAALILGILVPLLAILVADFFSTSIGDLNTIRKNIDAPILSVIPSIDFTKGKIKDCQTNSVCFDQVRRMIVSTNRLLLKERGPFSVIVTSCLPGEGKTFITSQTAIVLANQGKRILAVDFNFRNPGIDRIFGLKNSLGTLDVVLDNRDFKEVVQQTSLENLEVITTGALDNHLPERISMDAVTAFLKDAGAAYDYVLLDMPPISLSTHAIELSLFVDASIFVVQHGRTPVNSIKYIGDQVSSGLLVNLGVVYNDVDFKNPVNEPITNMDAKLARKYFV
jgi:tyrosine-protein kinase Etk/Wzc